MLLGSAVDTKAGGGAGGGVKDIFCFGAHLGLTMT